MSDVSQHLYIFNEPKQTGVRPLKYLADSVLTLANLLVKSDRFGVVWLDGLTMYAKSPEHEAVLSVTFSSDMYKNQLGRGRLVYLRGVAEMFEVDVEVNGGREHVLATLAELGTSCFFPGTLILEDVGEGLSQIHLEHRGSLAFDGTDQPPITDHYLDSALAYLEMVYQCVLRREKELEQLLSGGRTIYRRMDSWIERLESGDLKRPEPPGPGTNLAEGL